MDVADGTCHGIHVIMGRFDRPPDFKPGVHLFNLGNEPRHIPVRHTATIGEKNLATRILSCCLKDIAREVHLLLVHCHSNL